MRDKNCYCKYLPVRKDYDAGVIHLRQAILRSESGSGLMDNPAILAERRRNSVCTCLACGHDIPDITEICIVVLMLVEP